jgi:hypothetical protein
MIFLAGLAVLLALAVLGGRAGTHLFHHGDDEYLVRCDACARRYPRPDVIEHSVCPAGHELPARTVEHDVHSPTLTIVVALCLGFAVAVMVFGLTGHHLP